MTCFNLRGIAVLALVVCVVQFGSDARAAEDRPSELDKKLAELRGNGQHVKCAAFTKDGGWSILYGKNDFFNHDIPGEADGELKRLKAKGAELKAIAFAPNGGWSILHDKNGFFNRNVPDEAHQVMTRLQAQGAELKSIAFTPGGGWTVLYDKNGFFYRNVPDDLHRLMTRLQSQGAEFTSIAHAPDGGWILVHDRRHSNDKLPTAVQDELTHLARFKSRKEIGSVALGRQGYWVVLLKEQPTSTVDSLAVTPPVDDAWWKETNGGPVPNGGAGAVLFSDYMFAPETDVQRRVQTWIGRGRREDRVFLGEVYAVEREHSVLGALARKDNTTTQDSTRTFDTLLAATEFEWKQWSQLQADGIPPSAVGFEVDAPDGRKRVVYPIQHRVFVRPRIEKRAGLTWEGLDGFYYADVHNPSRDTEMKLVKFTAEDKRQVWFLVPTTN